jgi:hypothetical protein
VAEPPPKVSCLLVARSLVGSEQDEPQRSFSAGGSKFDAYLVVGSIGPKRRPDQVAWLLCFQDSGLEFVR